MHTATRRQSIPVTSRKVLREETKPSIGQRIKRLAKRAVSALKRAAFATGRVAKTVALKTKAAAKTVWFKTTIAWRTVLRPFLRYFGAFFGAVAWMSLLLTVPVATTAATVAAGLLLLGLSRALEALDGSNTRIAKVAIGAIEVIAQALRAAFYLASAACAVLSLPVWGPIVAIVGAAVIILRVLPRSEAIFSAPESMFETPARTRFEEAMDKTRAEAATRRQKIEVVEAEIVAPVKAKTIRAKGAEEMFNTPACAACGTIEGALRVRSTNEVLYVGESHSRQSDDQLCGPCFDQECEDNAVRFTGVSLKKMSTEVRLNAVGLATLAEHATSLTDAQNVHWSKTATVWWRDHNGTPHDREWSCFHNGNVVATVRFDYRRGVFRAAVMGKVVGGPQKSLDLARKLAADALFDEDNAASRIIKSLGELSSDTKVG